MKPCLDTHIRNPATKRCVKKTGKIGRALVPSSSSSSSAQQIPLRFVDQLMYLPAEMVFEIFKSFNAKDAKNFVLAYPHYEPFFQDKFLNQLSTNYKKGFMKNLLKEISTPTTIIMKLEKVLDTIAKYPNDKHVVYIGKTRSRDFLRILQYMESKNFSFLKHSYKNVRQIPRYVGAGIKNQLIRNSAERAWRPNQEIVFDYMTVGKITYANGDKKPAGLGTAKAIQTFFNQRKGDFKNTEGKHIKVLFISEKFKEGIDLLDTPHIHILNEPITADEKKQIIGRVVRRCSMASKKFEKGWKVNVFEYKITMPNYTYEKMAHWLGEGQESVQEENFKSIMKSSAVDKSLNKNLHNFTITKNKKSIETDHIFELRKPNTRLPFEQYNKEVASIYKRFEFFVDKIENKCLNLGEKFEFTSNQNFIRHYFNEQSNLDSILLWHMAGSGKTATSIATISSSFEQAGRNIIYVTRSSLVKDIEKNLFGKQTAHLHFRTNNLNKRQRQRYLKRNNWIDPMSYESFFNVISTHTVTRRNVTSEVNNSKKRALKRKTVGSHILENSLIVIDEVHKLTEEQMRLITREVVVKNYTKRPKIILMSATPFKSAAHEQFIAKIFSRKTSPKTNSKSEIIKYAKGQVSYYDPSKDVRYFPVPSTKIITVPVAIPNFDQCFENENREKLANTGTVAEKKVEKGHIKRRKAECFAANNQIGRVFEKHRYHNLKK